VPEPNGPSEKLQPEVDMPNSKAGTGWIATASVSVSVAAVLVTALIGLLGWMNTRNSQAYEEDKSEREIALNCVSSGATVANMAIALSKDFKDMPEDEKINYMNIIIASFPPDTASRFLLALSPLISKPEVLVAFQASQMSIGTLARTNQRHACPDAPPLIQAQRTAEGAAGPSLGPPPAAQQSDQQTPPSAPPPATTPALTVNYQITRQVDRDYAKSLAKEIDETKRGSDANTAFPSGGVLVVPTAAGLKQTEIRYYHQDQVEAAALLQGLIKENGRDELSGKIVYIGDKYPNLPPGRIEVWFQPLVDGYVALGQFENRTYQNFRIVSTASDDGVVRVGDIMKASRSVNLRVNTENTQSGTNSPLGTIPEGGCVKILERYDNIRGQTWAAVRSTACG
jgi:hypothetical protein